MYCFIQLFYICVTHICIHICDILSKGLYPAFLQINKYIYNNERMNF